MPETMPPCTLEELRLALKNKTFTVYIYVGKEEDLGWEVAQAAFAFLPALRVYRVGKRAAINPILNGQGGTARGIAFGYGPQPKQFLTKAEAEDLLVVTRAIAAARKK